jgi:trehalose synthase
MTGTLESYARIVGDDVIRNLRQLAAPLHGIRVVHVNSTKTGGGVAEILRRMVPLKRELGLDVSWEVITGGNDFFECTKTMHNGLQGNRVVIPEPQLRVYEETNAANAEALRSKLEGADIVFIHDPQPASLLRLIPHRKGKWVWRCHIDISRPHRPVWKYLRTYVSGYDASIWSLSAFSQHLPHPQYIIPPSIDPLSDKNRELGEGELRGAYSLANLDPARPIIVQVSRFDRFKDPIGVIQAYRLAEAFLPLQLVLAGGDASDDPEGEMVLQEVRTAAEGDPDIHVLALPADSHIEINALQRIADIILQKSTREGFGLTVTEGMWKGKPVIGGNTGGITLQVVNHHTGFLVDTPEGAAMRIRYLLTHPDILSEMGKKARRFVLENFLLTRHLREYLTLMVALIKGADERIEL